jgi:hypothetical protein
VDRESHTGRLEVGLRRHRQWPHPDEPPGCVAALINADVGAGYAATSETVTAGSGSLTVKRVGALTMTLAITPTPPPAARRLKRTRST